MPIDGVGYVDAIESGVKADVLHEFGFLPVAGFTAMIARTGPFSINSTESALIVAW